MLALLAAITVAAIPVADARPRAFTTDGAIRPACKPTGRYEIANPALLYRDDGKARMSALGALPKANHEKAVVRTIDGCAAPLVVGYDVGR